MHINDAHPLLLHCWNWSLFKYTQIESYITKVYIQILNKTNLVKLHQSSRFNLIIINLNFKQFEFIFNNLVAE